MMHPDLFKKLTELANTTKSLRTEKENQLFMVLNSAMTPVPLPCPHCGHNHSQAGASPVDDPWTLDREDDNYTCPFTGGQITFHQTFMFGLSYWSRPPIALPEDVTE